MIRFTRSHEWIRVDRYQATVGITQYAQQELGDIVYVELPQSGKEVQAGQEVAVLESTKAATDVYSPITGAILEVNESLKGNTDWLNRSPEDKGWLFKISIQDMSEVETLMDEKGYQVMIQGL